MIELIPAIDLINGQCVRLTKGDYDQKKVYNDNPAEVAKQFEQMGFKRLHVVDLDGAKSKHIVNDAVLKAITTETSLALETIGFVGTGISKLITELAACRFHHLSIAILIGWLLTNQG
mgnify:CR=1 FL=1